MTYLIWDGGKRGAVVYLAHAPIVRRHQRRAVRPVARVGRAVHGEDDIHLSSRLNKRVQRDVLQILATVHQCQSLGSGAQIASIVEPIERIRGVIGNVVVRFAETCQDPRNGVLEHAGYFLIADIQQELVEQRGRGPHDEAGVVEAPHARLVVW